MKVFGSNAKSTIGFFDDRGGDDQGFVGCSLFERGVANAVYVAWNPFGSAVNSRKRGRIEDIVAVVACKLEAMANVGGGFFERESLK